VTKRNGNKISTVRTEKEFWQIVNAPVKITQIELEERNKPVDMVALQKSIKEDGMGYVTYAKNHRDKR